MQVLPLSEWSARLADERVPLTLQSRHFGRQIRRDRWSPQQARQPWQVLYLIQEGSCAATIGAHQCMLEPGCLAWWPSQEPITLTWPPLFAFSELWFRLGDFRPPSELMLVQQATEAQSLFDACADELARPSNLHERRLRHLIALIILEFSRQRAPGRRLGRHQRQALAAYVRAHQHQRFSLPSLAEVAGLSADYFTRQFHATYGMAPRAWVVRERIHAAARMLSESHLPVHAVAEQLGYANMAQFCRQFRAIMGLSAGAWRRAPAATNA